MLDIIYYPVSAVLWAWHALFGFLVGAGSGTAWALSVILLVASVRGLLVPLAVRQLRSARRMQRLAPHVARVRERHRGDQRAIAEKTQALYREHGVNPLAGLLPALATVPVFLGLLQVLKGFRPDYPVNYLFDRADIVSFLDADLLGVRLTESVAAGAQTVGHLDLSHLTLTASVLPVAVPLAFVAALASHLTARFGTTEGTPGAVAAAVRWVVPAGMLAIGAFVPVAMLIYLAGTTVWTTGQQYLIRRRLDREDVGAPPVPAPSRAPRVGQRPVRRR